MSVKDDKCNWLGEDWCFHAQGPSGGCPGKDKCPVEKDPTIEGGIRDLPQTD